MAQEPSPPEPSPPDQPSEPSPPPEPPRRSRLGLKITLGVAAGVLLLGAAVAVAAITLFGEDVPEIGECMTDAPDPADLDVVDCGSDQAAWRVIGHHGSLTEDEFDQSSREDICQAYPDWENALWLRTNLLGGDGEVVCLVATEAAAAPE